MPGRALISWAHGRQAPKIRQARSLRSCQSCRQQRRASRRVRIIGASGAYGSLGLGVPRARREGSEEACRGNQTSGVHHRDHRDHRHDPSRPGILSDGPAGSSAAPTRSVRLTRPAGSRPARLAQTACGSGVDIVERCPRRWCSTPTWWWRRCCPSSGASELARRRDPPEHSSCLDVLERLGDSGTPVVFSRHLEIELWESVFNLALRERHPRKDAASRPLRQSCQAACRAAARPGPSGVGEDARLARFVVGEIHEIADQVPGLIQQVRVAVLRRCARRHAAGQRDHRLRHPRRRVRRPSERCRDAAHDAGTSPANARARRRRAGY